MNSPQMSLPFLFNLLVQLIAINEVISGGNWNDTIISTIKLIIIFEQNRECLEKIARNDNYEIYDNYYC